MEQSSADLSTDLVSLCHLVGQRVSDGTCTADAIWLRYTIDRLQLFSVGAYFSQSQSIKNQGLLQLFQGYRKLYFTLFINCLALLFGWLIHPLSVIIMDSLVLILWVVPEKKAETLIK